MCMIHLEKFMQRSLWNYPVLRPKILQAPLPLLCPWGRRVLHITTPCAIWDVGVSPQCLRDRPWKSVANLDKRKCLTSCHNPLSPSHNPFNILTFFYSQLKLKQNGVKFQSTRSTCTNCFIR